MAINLIRTNHPSLAEDCDKLGQYQDRQLWHQLTLVLEKIVASPEFATGTELLQLYDEFISKFEGKLNALKAAQLILAVCKQHSDATTCILFLNERGERFKPDKEAYILLRMEIGRLQLQLGEVEECKKHVEEGQAFISSVAEVDALVNSNIYLLTSLYHKFLGNAYEFYTNSLLYLAYTPLEQIAPEQQHALAFDLGIAALCGEKIYQFGELLLHPILSRLENTPQSWLVQLLQAFSQGDITAFERIVNTHSEALNAQPILAKNAQGLREKIRIFSLMELIRDRPATNRVIPFQDIGTHCGIPTDQVEYLIMKALSLSLVKGHIDQVDENVRITWVHPRVLELNAVGRMAERLSHWIHQVDHTAHFLDTETPEILA